MHSIVHVISLMDNENKHLLINRVLVKLEAINTSLPVHVRNISAVIGAIIAIQIAYGNIVYLKMKELQILVAESAR